MKTSMQYALGGALALALAACGGDESGGERAGGERAARDAAPMTQVSEEQASEALAALELAEPSAEVSWESRSFADGAYTFTNLTLTPEDGSGPSTVEEMVIAAPRVEDGVVLFDRFTISGGVFDADNDQIRVDRFEIDRPGPGLAGAITSALQERETEAPDTLEELAAYTFSRIALDGFRVEPTEPGGDEGAATLASFALEDFDGERLGRAALEGFDFSMTSPEGAAISAALESFSVEGLGAAFVLATINAQSEGESAPASSFANPFNPAEMYDAFSMTGLDVDAAGVLVSMPEMTATVEQGRDGLVRSVSAMPALTISADADLPQGAQLAQGLAMLGYEELVLSMKGETVYDPEADRVTTEGENYIELADGFRLSFDQDMGGVEEYGRRYMAALSEGALENGQLPPSVFEPLVIHRIAMRLEDRSLLERALDAAAQAQGSTPEALRAQAAGLVAMGMMAAPAEVPPQFMAEFSEAVTRFINEGGTLTAEMAPAEPVSVGTLMESANGGGFDPEALGLSVSAEPAE